MTPIEAKAVARLRALPVMKQQQVLDFIEFLHVQRSTSSVEPPLPQEKGISFAEAAARYVGCLDGGPDDLSTNPKYMEGFGE